jgi:hypothetical protein
LRIARPALACVLLFCAGGCGSPPQVVVQSDGGNEGSGFGAVIGYVDGATPDTSWLKAEGGFFVPDVGVVPADRFITKVISVTYGPCAGFGQDQFPEIVEGPPQGALDSPYSGGTNVLSLGNGGEIVVSFEPNAIVDGDGPDFIVFENPFYIDGNPDHIYAEPAEVSVSDDGVNWTSFAPCTDTTNDPPYQNCAGIHPVLSNPENGISPFDPAKAGGDPYDLATIGVKHANYVRIVDKVIEPCSPPTDDTTKNGFDLDAIAIINAEIP